MVKEHSFGILNSGGMAGYKCDSYNSCISMLIDNPAAACLRFSGSGIQLPRVLEFQVLMRLRDSACSLAS